MENSNSFNNQFKKSPKIPESNSTHSTQKNSIKNNELSDIIKIELTEKLDIKDFKVFYKLNSYIKNDSKIGEYKIAEKTFPLNSPICGKILEIDQEEYKIVIERCKHDQTYINLCVFCGFDVRNSKELSQKKNINTYVSISNTIGFSEERAKFEEKKIVNKYLNNKKLILLLDLDNTILHSADYLISEEEYNDLKNLYDWQIAKLCCNGRPFVVKFRPYLKEFFELISCFDIYIYTHGTVEYARELIRYLNKQLDLDLSNEKLVAREGNNVQEKSIKKIFPSTDYMVLLIDDRVDVWDSSKENLINIGAYFFWNAYKENKIKFERENKENNLNNFRTEKKEFKHIDTDSSLYSLGRALRFTHAVFYRDYELHGNNLRTQSAKNIFSKKMQRIFYRKNFCILGIYNTKEIDVFETKHNFAIENFGGNLYEDYSPNVDYIIMRKYKENSKTRKHLEEGKKIISDLWLIFSQYFFSCLNEEDFYLGDNYRIDEKVYGLDTSYILKRNYKIINDFFSIEKDKLDEFLFLEKNFEIKLKENDNVIKEIKNGDDGYEEF